MLKIYTLLNDRAHYIIQSWCGLKNGSETWIAISENNKHMKMALNANSLTTCLLQNLSNDVVVVVMPLMETGSAGERRIDHTACAAVRLVRTLRDVI